MTTLPVKIASTAALALALTSCSPAAEPQPFGVPPSTTPSAPAGQTPAEVEMYGPRVELPGGVLGKRLGKVAELSRDELPDGAWTVRVVLDRIEVDPSGCGPYVKPERGHRLVLHLRVETSEHYDAAQGDPAPASYAWSTVDTEGISEGGYHTEPVCRSAESLPVELRPAARYRGQVAVDTANAEGQLVFNNMFAWDYPTG